MATDRKKIVAATLAVLETLRKEKTPGEQREGRSTVSLWALSGRIAQIQCSESMSFRRYEQQLRRSRQQ